MTTPSSISNAVPACADGGGETPLSFLSGGLTRIETLSLPLARGLARVGERVEMRSSLLGGALVDVE